MKIYFSDDLAGKIRSLSAKNNRSMNAEINALVEHGARANSLETVVSQSINRCFPTRVRDDVLRDALRDVLNRSVLLMARDKARSFRDGCDETSHEFQMLQDALEYFTNVTDPVETHDITKL